MNHTNTKVAVHFDTTTSMNIPFMTIPSYTTILIPSLTISSHKLKRSSIAADTAIRIDLYLAGVYYFTHTT